MRTEKFKTMVVAKEGKVSQKGEPYGVISIMDGSKVLNVVTKDDKMFNAVECYKTAEVVLNIELGKYPKVEFVSIENV